MLLRECILRLGLRWAVCVFVGNPPDVAGTPNAYALGVLSAYVSADDETQDQFGERTTDSDWEVFTDASCWR